VLQRQIEMRARREGYVCLDRRRGNEFKMLALHSVPFTISPMAWLGRKKSQNLYDIGCLADEHISMLLLLPCHPLESPAIKEEEEEKREERED
jgi:hypothetical protein